MWKLNVTLILTILAIRFGHIAALCNQCKDGFACISENEFQLCFSGAPDQSKNYTCPGGNEVCSRYGRICMPRSDLVTPACRGIENCRCTTSADFQFACTSRTTFTMCLNQDYTTTRGSCPKNQICDVSKGKRGEIPCTNKCIEDVPDALICDFENPVDIEQPETTIAPSTVTPPSTITPTTNSPTPETSPTTGIITPTPPGTNKEICRNQAAAGRFPYPNDTVCTDYVYCYWNGLEWIGGRRTCPTGRYFDRTVRNCVATRPSWCTSG